MRKKQIRLDQPTVAGITARLARIQALEMDLQIHRNELNAFLQESTGADFNREDWSLDLDHALLERVAVRARKYKSGSDN